MKHSETITTSFYPETRISGYTSIDGTVEFYNRIHSLIDHSMTVLDFGAGRGEAYEDDHCSFRKNLRTLQGKVNKVIGCDVDEAILKNRCLDEKLIVTDQTKLPFADQSIDLIISDWTFEHITTPQHAAAEFHRILKPGGWVCARTPNKYSYTSIVTRVVKNQYHPQILRHAQPGRKEIDIFPTAFKLNSLRDIEKHFQTEKFDNFTYRYLPEPSYHFNNKLIFASMMLINKILPLVLTSTLLIFLRKR